MIKILLVDDQQILLDGIAEIFSVQPDIEVVGTCTLSELAEEACWRLRPDLVLMDICMEGRTSGIQICERLKKRFPRIRVVLMTGMQEIAFLDWAKAAGADSFIYKEASGEDFAACIRETMDEEIAQALGIKKRTVHFHVGNMLEKTGYKSLIGLAVEAAEKGYAGIEAQAEEE